MSQWDLYNAARRYATNLAGEIGISAAGRKRFVQDNTRFILDDCKRNPAVKRFILDNYKRR